MLIEFLDADRPDFIADLLAALAPVKPRVSLADGPQLDDEYVMDLVTTVGDFCFDKDPWGSGFILHKDNSEGLATVEGLLRAAETFSAVSPSP